MSDYETLTDTADMPAVIIKKRVTGASHLRSGKECQDSLDSRILADGTVLMAVADGHGSSSCPFSADGSRIAVETFLDMLQELCDGFHEDREQLIAYLNRSGDTSVARTLWVRWEETVFQYHKAQGREPLQKNDISDAEYRDIVRRCYGTTLLGLMLTDAFLFAFQLGDGDMMYLTPESISPVLEADKLLGVETHSLGSSNGWKKAITLVHSRPTEAPYLFMLTTDGFSNSYATDAEYQNTCADYFRVLQQLGPQAVEDALEGWLNETSAGGCGDDISMLLYYCDTPAVTVPVSVIGDSPAAETASEENADLAEEAEALPEEKDSACEEAAAELSIPEEMIEDPPTSEMDDSSPLREDTCACEVLPEPKAYPKKKFHVFRLFQKKNNKKEGSV